MTDAEALVALHTSLMRSITLLQDLLGQRDAEIAELKAQAAATNGRAKKKVVADA